MSLLFIIVIVILGIPMLFMTGMTIWAVYKEIKGRIYTRKIRNLMKKDTRG